MTIVTPGVANRLAFAMVAKLDGSPITAGTVNLYLIAMNGANEAQWFKTSDDSWQVTVGIAGAATYLNDGVWAGSIDAAAWIEGTRYAAYAVGAGDLGIRYSKDILCSAFPATVDDIAVSVQTLGITGAAIAAPVTAVVLTTYGSEVNAYTDTETANGIRYTLTDLDGTLTFECHFELGADGVPISLTVLGALTSSDDDLSVQAWDFADPIPAWQTIGTRAGVNQTTNFAQTHMLNTHHASATGTVWIRFTGTGLSTATFYIDQCYVSYAVVVTPAANADAAWDELMTPHAIADSAAVHLKAAAAAAVFAGSSVVTLTYKKDDALGVPVGNVIVEVFDATLTTCYHRDFTNAAGQLTFACKDGTYKIVSIKQLWAFTVPETLVVLGATADEYYGVEYTPAVPILPGYVVVYGYTLELVGSYLVGSKVKATVAKPPATVGVLGTLIAIEDLEVFTDVSGVFQLQLPTGVEVIIEIPDVGYTKKITVPAANTNLKDL